MQIRVLGCAGAEFPDFRTTGFLLDDSLLLDGGTVGAVLTEDEQRRIKHILVTHAHLDHIKGIPLLADNLLVRGECGPVTVYGLPATLAALQDHLMNNIIWPDFSRLPTPDAPLIVYQPVTPGIEVAINGYRVTPWPMPHAVPAVGYRIAAGHETLFFTGDTGGVGTLWPQIWPLQTLLIEVSFPDELVDLARLTGHLTPRLLAQELAAMPQHPARVLISHLKPQYRQEICRQLAAVVPEAEILSDGAVYRFKGAEHDN